MKTLTVCSQQESIDKLLVLLASPLRVELINFVKSAAGMELFSIDVMWDMYESQCFMHWNKGLKSYNDFVKGIMGESHTRYFDITLMNKLANLGSRDESNVANLFWPPTSGI